MPVRRILSIDGGGVRGIIPALILAYIEQRAALPITTLFDTIAGTSTGGIIALCLTKPNPDGSPCYSAAQCAQLYEKSGQKIFPPFDLALRKFLAIRAFKPFAYCPSGLETVVADYLGDTLLSQASSDLLIYSARVFPPGIFTFKRFESFENEDANFAMKDIARATSAASTYFPPATIKNRSNAHEFNLIDGGTLVNNPALRAYYDSKTRFPDHDVFVLSVGTGAVTHKNQMKAQDGFTLAPLLAARKLISFQMDGTSKQAHRDLMSILPIQLHQNGNQEHRRYYRIQCRLESDAEDLDNSDPKNLKKLRNLAQEMIDDSRDVLDFIAMKLVALHLAQQNHE